MGRLEYQPMSTRSRQAAMLPRRIDRESLSTCSDNCSNKPIRRPAAVGSLCLYRAVESAPLPVLVCLNEPTHAAASRLVLLLRISMRNGYCLLSLDPALCSRRYSAIQAQDT